MRKKLWVLFVSLVALTCSVAAPAPVLADAGIVTEESPIPLGRVIDGYQALVGWVGNLLSLDGPDKLSDPEVGSIHSEGNLPQDPLTGPESTGCELDSCTEAGPDFDPNG